MNEAIAPAALRLQCPACGEPVANTALRIVMPAPDVKAIELQCGHAVTMEMAQDHWGLDL